jgi:hypothetical protein
VDFGGGFLGFEKPIKIFMEIMIIIPSLRVPDSRIKNESLGWRAPNKFSGFSPDLPFF